MSNRRKLRRPKMKRKRCTKCGGREFLVKVYGDATMFVCRDCHFPERVEKVSP